MPHGAPAPLLDWARWNGRKERTSATSTSGRPPIWERYQTFIKENPHVLEEALHLARGKLAAGAKRIGAKALWEELRASIKTKKLGTYTFNNDFTALLARDLIAAEPRLERVIELRERKTRIDKAGDLAMSRKCSVDLTTECTPVPIAYEVLENELADPHRRYSARLVRKAVDGGTVVVIDVYAPTSDGAVAELRAALERILGRIV